MVSDQAIAKLMKIEVSQAHLAWGQLTKEYGAEILALGSDFNSKLFAEGVRELYDLGHGTINSPLLESAQAASRNLAANRGLSFLPLSGEEKMLVLEGAANSARRALNYSINRHFIPNQFGVNTTAGAVLLSLQAAGRKTSTATQQNSLARSAEKHGVSLKVSLDVNACKHCRQMAVYWEERGEDLDKKVNFPNGFHNGSCKCIMTWK